MMRWILLAASFCVWAPTTCLRTPDRAVGDPVGLRNLELWRSPDLHPVAAQVWYPAAPSARERAISYRGTSTGHVAPDAAPQAGLHPLVVMSHGLAGSRFDLSWLAEALARDGFVVVAVEHNAAGSNADTDGTSHNLWQRAEDLSSAVDTVLANPSLGPVVDARRVAAAGFSLGGSSALVDAGAELDPVKFAQRFPNVPHAPAGSYHDARVRAAVCLAPGTGPVFAPEGIARVSVPVLLVGGEADRIAPVGANAGYYAAHLPRAELRSLPNATHYSFTPECSVRAALREPRPCIDALGTDRHRVHAQVVDLARRFLRQQMS
jgi:predicted dienelactone hydrolase